MKLKNIIDFLTMILDADNEIWVNDYLNKDTHQGKMFDYCLQARLIETWTQDADPEGSGYPEQYASITDLGYSIVDMKRDLDHCVAKLTGHEKQRQARLLGWAGKEGNPLLKNGLFATPESFESLRDYCLRHNGSERTAAITCSEMAINLCYDVVERQINS